MLKYLSDLTSLDRTRYPSTLHELTNHSVNTVNVYANLEYAHGTKYLVRLCQFSPWLSQQSHVMSLHTSLCARRCSEFSWNLRSEKALLLSNCDCESYQPKEESKLSRIYFIFQDFFLTAEIITRIFLFALIKLSEASWISKTNIHVFSFLTDVTFLSKLSQIDLILFFFRFAFKIITFLRETLITS